MPDNEIKGAVDKLAVPIYEDALKPFAKEISNGLVSIARMANSGIYLLEDCVVTTNRVLRMVAENLALLPVDEISFERPRVALHALNEAKFAINEEEIQKLFANLISASLIKNKINMAHPAYVEIIKQLTPDEALILQFMFQKEKHQSGHAPTINVIETGWSGVMEVQSTTPDINLICEDARCMIPDNSVAYFSNLKRIGLLSASTTGASFSKEEHERIFTSDKVKKMLAINPSLKESSYTCGQFSFTEFGHGFVTSCIDGENCI